MDIDEQVRQLKLQIANAQKTQIRAEQVYESAKDTSEKAKERLRVDFGVNTTEEAKALLHTLQGNLQEMLTEAQQAITEIG